MWTFSNGLTMMEHRVERLMGIRIAAPAGMMLLFAPLFEVFFLALTAINWRSIVQHLPVSRASIVLSFATLNIVSIVSLALFGLLTIYSVKELAQRIQRSSPRQLDSFKLYVLSAGLAIFSPVFVAAIVGRFGILDILYAMVLPGILGHVMLCHIFAKLALSQPATNFPPRPDNMDPAEYGYIRRLGLMPGSEEAKWALGRVTEWRDLVKTLGERLQECRGRHEDCKRRLVAAEGREEVKQRQMEEAKQRLLDQMTTSRDRCAEKAESLRRQRDTVEAERQDLLSSLDGVRNSLRARDTELCNQIRITGALVATNASQASTIASLKKIVDRDVTFEIQLAIDTERHEAELREVDSARAKERAEAEYLGMAYRQQAEWAEEEHAKTKESLRRVGKYVQRLQDELDIADKKVVESGEQLDMKCRSIKALTELVTRSNNERVDAQKLKEQLTTAEKNEVEHREQVVMQRRTIGTLKEQLETADENEDELREQVDMQRRTIGTLRERIEHMKEDQVDVARKAYEYKHEVLMQGTRVRKLKGMVRHLENERDGVEFVERGEVEDSEMEGIEKADWIEECQGGDCGILECFCKRVVTEEGLDRELMN